MKTKTSLTTTGIAVLCGACLFITSTTIAQTAISTPPKILLKVVKADSEETQGENGSAANAVDGDSRTLWHTQYSGDCPNYPHEIVLELVQPAAIKGFTYLPRPATDDGSVGNGTIKKYEIYVSNDGTNFGQPVASGVFQKTSKLKTVLFDLHECRFVKLKALSEANGGPWATAAEIGVLSKDEAVDMTTDSKTTDLKLVKADSEETQGENGSAANAVDGDPSTLWHTQYSGDCPNYPHEITLELVQPAAIKGFTYLPRPAGPDGAAGNGTIKDYEFYVSTNGVDFGKPVAAGTFEGASTMKTVSFEARDCRFVKLKALSEVNGGPWASAAEIGVVK